MIPCACWTMPTSSTSVSRWSVRRLVRCRSATPSGLRRGASSSASCKTSAVASRDRRPRERRADPLCLGARGDKRLRSLDVVADCVGERVRIVERNDEPRRPRRACPARTSRESRRQPQPAAIANVSAPEAICSRLPYGVTKTSVAASKSESSSIERNRSSNSTWSPSPSSSTRRSSIRRYRSPSRCATSGWVRPAIM